MGAQDRVGRSLILVAEITLPRDSLHFVMPGQYAVNPVEHTLNPIVTGSTVIGVKYDGGVMIAADALASYGSQARYKDFVRMRKVGSFTLLGASGEMSDFQYMG